MISFQSDKFMHLRLLTALASILLSTLAYYSDDIINSDAVLYVYTIQAFTEGGISAMSELYNWPFFSIITSLFSQLTHIPAELSAKIICGALFVLFTDSLLQLSTKILPAERYIVIAAVLIICFSTINNYRDFIIRDIGYWAFCSLAVYQFICFLETQKGKHAVLWQTFIIIAILFRIEGAVLLVLTPLFLAFSKQQKKKLQAFFSLYSLTILTVGLSIVVIINNDISSAFSKVSQITSYLNFENLLSNFEARVNIINSQIMHSAADDYGSMVLFSGLVSIALYAITKGISVPYLLLTFLAIKQSRKPVIPQHLPFLLYFFLINAFILIVFTLHSSLVTDRYSILAITILFLMLLPTLCQFINTLWLQNKNVSISLVGLLLFVSVADVFISSSSKEHIKTVSKLAAQTLPENSRVMTTDSKIQYYFDVNSPKAKITLHRNINHYPKYDYIILFQKHKNKDPLPSVKGKFLELFYEESGKRNKTVIYKVMSKSSKELSP